MTYVLVGNKDEPFSYYEVVSDSQPKQWKTTMDEEMYSLHKNETLNLCKLTKGKKPIKCKWVLTKTDEALGTEVLYKARVVAKGFA